MYVMRTLFNNARGDISLHVGLTRLTYCNVMRSLFFLGASLFVGHSHEPLLNVDQARIPGILQRCIRYE